MAFSKEEIEQRKNMLKGEAWLRLGQPCIAFEFLKLAGATAQLIECCKVCVLKNDWLFAFKSAMASGDKRIISWCAENIFLNWGTDPSLLKIAFEAARESDNKSVLIKCADIYLTRREFGVAEEIFEAAASLE